MKNIKILELISENHKTDGSITPYWDIHMIIEHHFTSQRGNTIEEVVCEEIKKLMPNTEVIRERKIDLAIKKDKEIYLFEIKATDNHDKAKIEGECTALLNKAKALNEKYKIPCNCKMYFLSPQKKNQEKIKEYGIEVLHGNEIFRKLPDKEERYNQMMQRINEKCPLSNSGKEIFNFDENYIDNAIEFYRVYGKKTIEIVDRIPDSYWELLSPKGLFKNYIVNEISVGRQGNLF